jgi:hypothetical protein
MSVFLKGLAILKALQFSGMKKKFGLIFDQRIVEYLKYLLLSGDLKPFFFTHISTLSLLFKNIRTHTSFLHQSLALIACCIDNPGLFVRGIVSTVTLNLRFMKLFTTTFITVFMFLAGCAVYGQTSVKSNPQMGLPSVFILGEYDKQYNETVPAYGSLLDACNGDMQVAYNKLMSLMQEMEAYAALEQYDLKGINAWMHLFFKPDGSIEHIGFHLKPNSRNVSTDRLKEFLEGFARQYKFPLSAGSKFSHYSSFSFPVVVNQASDSNKGITRKNVNGGQ